MLLPICYTIHEEVIDSVSGEKEGDTMNMQEMARLIEGLRALGLNGDELADFLLWVESGDKSKLPKREKKDTQKEAKKETKKETKKKK